jgi:hypothetical protein
MEKEITLVLNYLDKIGEKLGIGANMLWPYMMKQQIIEAYINVAVIVLLAAIGLFTWSRYVKNPQRHEDKWVDGMYFYAITMIASCALGFIAIVRFLFHGVFQLVNTEYMAFSALVELVGKVK